MKPTNSSKWRRNSRDHTVSPTENDFVSRILTPATRRVEGRRQTSRSGSAARRCGNAVAIAGSAVRRRPVGGAPDLSSHGRRRQGWRDQARDVRRQSAGLSVTSFKTPSSEELDHDYLWRCEKHLPERGRIGIFNRSYYEEVLVVRVHPELLERSGSPRIRDQHIWKERYKDIHAFERTLAAMAC